MLFQRASRGLIGDTAALLLLALAFTALMGLILQQLIHAIRTRVSLDAVGLKMTVPVVGKRGPFFLFHYASHDVPYTQVSGVETRSEVYGGTLAPLLLKSTRVMLKDGPGIVLGYTNANDALPQMPYPEIGAELALRAGTRVVDHGVVHRSLQGRILGSSLGRSLGLTSQAEAVSTVAPAAIATLNAAHTRNLRLLVGALTVLVIGGIVIDFATASRTSFAEMGAGLANPSTSAAPVPKKKQ
jgi:hypothetical protein